MGPLLTDATTPSLSELESNTIDWLVGWLVVGWFYSVSTLLGTFNAELNFSLV